MNIILVPAHLDALSKILDQPCAQLGVRVPIVESQRTWFGVPVGQPERAFVECFPVLFETPDGDQIPAFLVGGAKPGRWITEWADADERLDMPLGYCQGQWFYNPLLCGEER